MSAAPRRSLRIAHRGYRTIARENSLDQIAHAIELGCDMVEVDVRRRRDGALVLDHDDAERSGAPLLADGLALLAQANVRANLDLKVGGIVGELVAAIRAAGMTGLTTCTGGGWDTLRAVRDAEPGVRIGLTLPRRSPPGVPGLQRLAARSARPRLAREIPEMLAAFAADLVTVNWRLIDERVVAAVHACQAEIWAWTVDAQRVVHRLETLGVDGICSNRPESHGLR